MIDVEAEDPAWEKAAPNFEALTLAAAGAALPSGEVGGVSVLLADDATLRDLNARFRGKDQATNVLSFPMADASGRADCVPLE